MEGKRRVPGERYTINNPDRVRAAIDERMGQLGLERADVIAVQLSGWKQPLGSWTYDRVMKHDPEPLIRDKLHKFSLALGWEHDGIERIDAGLEPVQLPAPQPTPVSSQTEKIAVLEARLEALERRIAEGAESAGGPPGGAGERHNSL